MSKIIITLAFALVLVVIGCKSLDVVSNNSITLKFLDEHIIPDDLYIDNFLVGGFSGIDYHNGLYYLACDDADNPRYYEANIEIENDKISNIEIEKAIIIKDSTKYLDFEAIRFDPETNLVFLTAEGHLEKQEPPFFISCDSFGEIQNSFKIPEAFYPNHPAGPRHNAILEGLSKSIVRDNYWIAMELPLTVDGPTPRLEKTISPLRITRVDINKNETVKQFAYLLDAMSKEPRGPFAINGLTELLEYKKDKFFIIERSYSDGFGYLGNTVKIYIADAYGATNTLDMSNLMESHYLPAKKKLLLNFDQLRDKLTNNSIDNIEGITFGPRLSNGNQSLILVSDNNFNKYGYQSNQFILLEIIENKTK